ncbi:EamA family transporter [Bacillus thermotolerans]|uniref:EamA family transporter n=1 Tax=Bacillus thermotolerans TaxID=1221996 RepID=UPI0005894FA0|nr:EamA family transporter [Bacillus thermotolerans]KKB42030.1 Permease of the drug/metabolite transporter (DMT) superfamily [Bacillus thermotolerans]
MRENVSALFVLLAAILWGTTGTAQTFLPAGVHPVVVAAMRIMIGGLFLLVIVLVQRKLDWTNWPVKNTLAAAVAMAFFQPFFFSAVKITGVAVGTVVTIGSAPVLAGLLEWLFFRKKPSLRWWGATALSVVGCLLLFAGKEAVVIEPAGVALALGGGFTFAAYTLVTKQLLAEKPPEAVVAVVFSLSALFLLPFLWIYDLSWITQMSGVMVSLHVGILATGLAYLLFSRGLTGVPASTAVTLSLAEPLTAALLGVFYIGEVLPPSAWAGVGLLFLGIVLLTLSPGARMSKAPHG